MTVALQKRQVDRSLAKSVSDTLLNGGIFRDFCKYNLAIFDSADFLYYSILFVVHVLCFYFHVKMRKKERKKKQKQKKTKQKTKQNKKKTI